MPNTRYKQPKQHVKRLRDSATSDFLLREADSWRPEAWRMMRERGDLRFFFITKRISRLKQCLPPDWGEGYPNVEICCTVEDQKRAGERVPILQSAPCAAKSIACEPLIGPVDLTPWLGGWVRRVVVGGESGPGARVCDYDWVLSLRGQCVERGVAFSFRQTGARLKKDGRLYHIERPLQHRQAKKAGIDTDGGPDRKTREDC